MLPDEDILLADLADFVPRVWNLDELELTRLGGGMTSWTGLVQGTDSSAVLKCVDASLVGDLERGAVTAKHLATFGLTTGTPWRTREGDLAARRPWGAAILMDRVTGRELTSRSDDQERMAAALAKVHSIPMDELHTLFMPDLGSDARLADLGVWILPAIHNAVSSFHELDTPWGLVNTDPSLDSFLLDEATGTVGIIDWAGSGPGPVLYDVASAVMYLGGPHHSQPFLTAYQELSPLEPNLIDQQLDTLRRLRAAVQADYFGRRIINSDMTGIEDPSENQRGLDDARSLFNDLKAAER